MTNGQQLYNSAGMPIGTRKVYVYRQTNPGLNPATGLAGAPAFTNGAAAAGNAVAGNVLLGLYLCENFNWKAAGKVIRRMDNVGADLDLAILRQPITGSSTTQLATGFTPLLFVGDWFELSPGYEQDGATPLPYQRFVVADATKDESEGQAQKMNLSLEFDRNNSDPFWQS